MLTCYTEELACVKNFLIIIYAMQKTGWGTTYYREVYLKSEEWATVRIEAMARADARCSMCGKRDLSNDAHHIFYPQNWFHTKAHHLRILCRGCHERVHGLQLENARTIEQARVIFAQAQMELVRIDPSLSVSQPIKLEMELLGECYVCDFPLSASYCVVDGTPIKIRACDCCIERYPELVKPVPAAFTSRFWFNAKAIKRAAQGCASNDLEFKT